MRFVHPLAVALSLAIGHAAFADAPKQRLNPAPSNFRHGIANDAPLKSPAQLARETVSYKFADFIFDGSMVVKIHEIAPDPEHAASHIGQQLDLGRQRLSSRSRSMPLNPDGELISWVIVESRAGLQNVRAIAAVPGIGVLWPGAGTLRQVFSTPEAAGRAVVDEAAWEAGIKTIEIGRNLRNASGAPG